MLRVAGDGVALAVHEWPGKRPPRRTVLGIHGLTANHRCWASMAETLPPGYRLVAYDLRGRGDSDKPATDYSLTTHGRDLASLLEEDRQKQRHAEHREQGGDAAERDEQAATEKRLGGGGGDQPGEHLASAPIIRRCPGRPARR